MNNAFDFCKKNSGGMFLVALFFFVFLFSRFDFVHATDCCYDPTPNTCTTNLSGCPGDIVKCDSPSCDPDTTTPATEVDAAHFFNPIEYDSLETLTEALLDNLYSFVVGLTLIFIVLGGVLYMLSTGDPGMVQKAKNCWLFALVGFAIVVAAPTFLEEIITILGSTLVVPEDRNSLSEIIAATVNLLLSLLGMLCIIGLTVAGGMYLTAYGEDERIKTAKKIAQYSVVGLVVALSSLIVIEEVEGLIGSV